ncbi:hypothetical protein HZC31_03790 [Candidatus Woesearchaeota archaeon]|nr:hypothetical protein [Candidatus Woesearchaeota archaeon]
MEKQQSKRSLYIAAGIVGTLIIGGSALAVRGVYYAVTTIGSEIKTAYQKSDGSYVPSQYVQAPASKTPSRLEEVVQQGDWLFSNGMTFTVEQSDEGIDNKYFQYLPEKIRGEDNGG